MDGNDARIIQSTLKNAPLQTDDKSEGERHCEEDEVRRSNPQRNDGDCFTALKRHSQ